MNWVKKISDSASKKALRCGNARNWVLLVAVGVFHWGLFGCASKQSAPVVEREVVVAPSSKAHSADKPGTSTNSKSAKEAALKKDSSKDWRPETYTVKRGDTLYGIALDHGLDYKELAAWNNIENPNRILVGQALLLQSPTNKSASESPADAANTEVVVTPLKTTETVQETAKSEQDGDATVEASTTKTSKSTLKTQPKALKLAYSEAAVAQLSTLNKSGAEGKTANAANKETSSAEATRSDQGKASVPKEAEGPVSVVSPPKPPVITPPGADSKVNPPSVSNMEDEEIRVDWSWPTTGKIIASFGDSPPNKGIDIAGKAGQPIYASATGKVVYSGTGLRGYGKLLIIKHNKTYLSAYAHNREILVKEGEQVKKNQKIAEMGNTDSEQTKLHFEIRRLGKPVDPLKYLPAERP